jgi:hypothetical protein
MYEVVRCLVRSTDVNINVGMHLSVLTSFFHPPFFPFPFSVNSRPLGLRPVPTYWPCMCVRVLYTRTNHKHTQTRTQEEVGVTSPPPSLPGTQRTIGGTRRQIRGVTEYEYLLEPSFSDVRPVLLSTVHRWPRVCLHVRTLVTDPGGHCSVGRLGGTEPPWRVGFDLRRHVCSLAPRGGGMSLCARDAGWLVTQIATQAHLISGLVGFKGGLCDGLCTKGAVVDDQWRWRDGGAWDMTACAQNNVALALLPLHVSGRGQT